MLEKWKVIVCTQIKEESSSSGPFLCISAITNLHSSHVSWHRSLFVVPYVEYCYHGRVVLHIVFSVINSIVLLNTNDKSPMFVCPGKVNCHRNLQYICQAFLFVSSLCEIVCLDLCNCEEDDDFMFWCFVSAHYWRYAFAWAKGEGPRPYISKYIFSLTWKHCYFTHIFIHLSSTYRVISRNMISNIIMYVILRCEHVGTPMIYVYNQFNNL